jgi:hypothetical protein
MKRGLISLAFVFFVFSLAGVFSIGCDLDISLVNQDPYPAIPGEELKIVFQVDGLKTSECGNVRLELVEEYPMTLSPGQVEFYQIESGTFTKDFQSFFIAPFRLRVAENALDGSTPIKIRYKIGSNTVYITEEFNIEIDNVLADFEVHVKDYDSNTRNLVFEILNIASSDVEALTVEIPKQENVEIKGSKINIVGDLDSNEYTTADFEAIPREGEITLKISYSDSTNTRRVIEKSVLFEPGYFQGRLSDEKPSRAGTYIFLVLVLLVIAYFIYKRNKKKRVKIRRK